MEPQQFARTQPQQYGYTTYAPTQDATSGMLEQIMPLIILMMMMGMMMPMMKGMTSQ